MRYAWNRFLAPLKPGVRVLLGLMLGMYLLLWIGRWTDTFDLYQWLALFPSVFWHGEVWGVFTYVLLPFGIVDLVLNAFMITWLGAWLERVWSRSEFWLYCAIGAVGTGLAKVLLTPTSPGVLVGTGGVVFGLLAAWAAIFGRERVLLMAVWETSVWTAALLIGGFNLLVMLPCGGLLNVLVMLCGGLTGWGYLMARRGRLLSARSQTFESERIGRLEI